MSAGGGDAYLAKFDASGKPLWSKRFGDVFSQGVDNLALDGDGNVVITGWLVGSADFGQGSLVSGGALDVFVAKFDPSGDPLWSKRMGGQGHHWVAGVGVDGEGSILLVGDFDGMMDVAFPAGLDDFPWVGTLSPTIFVIKLDQGGAFRWMKLFEHPVTDPSEQVARGIVMDEGGNFVVAGRFSGSLRFGNGVDTVSSMGGYDVFVARFHASGELAWMDRFGDTGDQDIWGVRMTGEGTLMVGENSSAGGASEGCPAEGNTGGKSLIIKIDASGRVRENRSIHDTMGFVHGRDMVINPAGEALVLGNRSGVAPAGRGSSGTSVDGLLMAKIGG